MSNNFNNYLGLIFNSNSKISQKKEIRLKERNKSTSPCHIIPHIITQLKPFPLNNFSQSINLHKLSFTPTNKSRDFLQSQLLLPPKSKECQNKKTLILDLDETLVHSTTTYVDSDITLEVDFEGILYNIYVLIRPGAENFIKKISKFFEIVVFTASLSKYASPLLDKLDPDKNIKYRLYREHCTFLNGIYIKELKRLNRDLKDIIIVDNSPSAYSFDVESGLPISSWYEDKNDNELEIILPILEFLSQVDDVRDYISLFVENNEIKYERAFHIIGAMKNYNNNCEDKKINEKNNIEENNKYNKDNINKLIKNKNILSLHDFLNSSNNKIIGNMFKKNLSKSNLKIEETKISINKKNETNKTDNNNINNMNGILKENNKAKKTSYRNKKNAFRLNKNLAHMSLKNLHSNDTNKKINSLLPLSLSLTNSTKMINIKNKGNNMNNLKLLSIKDTNNNNTNSKNNLNKFHLYTNLIEQLKARKDLYNNSSTNNTNCKNNNIILKRNSKSFKLTKHKSLLIKTPNLNQQGYFHLKKNNPIYPIAKTARSKSTGNFIQFNNNNKNNHPKTPKTNQRLFNLENIDKKNSFKFDYTKKLDTNKLTPNNSNKFTPSFNQQAYKIKIKKLGFKIK